MGRGSNRGVGAFRGRGISQLDPPPVRSQGTIKAFLSEAWTDSGAVAAGGPATSAAAGCVFAPIAAAVARGAVLVAVFSRHHPSVVPGPGGPRLASLSVSVAPAPPFPPPFPLLPVTALHLPFS